MPVVVVIQVFKLGSKLFLIAMTSFVVYILMSVVLGLGEVQPIVKKVKDVVLGAIKINDKYL